MSFLEVDGKQIYYEVEGEGKPLVLVHSSLTHSGMYEAQMKAFAPRYKVIRYDQYGFGKSAFTDQKKVDDVGELEALLDHLGIQKACLLGTSMGAEMVLNFTLQKPERVNGMILVGAALEGHDVPGADMRWWEAFISAVREPDTSKAIQIFLDGAIDSKTTPLTPELRNYLEKMMSEYSFQHFRDNNLQYKQMAGDAPAKRLGEIHCPTLVMIGEGDTAMMLEFGDVIAKGISRAQKLVVNGAAHLVNLQQPEAFNKAVMAFMDGLG